MIGDALYQQQGMQKCGQCSAWYYGGHICATTATAAVPFTGGGWLYPAYVTADDIRKIVREEIAAALKPKRRKRA